MPLITVKEASAASAVGTNLMAGNRLQVASSYRRIRRIGFVGSTNPGDASIDIFYGDKFVGTHFITTGGANIVPKSDGDMFFVTDMSYAEPGEPLNILISDATATNIGVVTMEIEEFKAV